jgi:hypothetical protein
MVRAGLLEAKAMRETLAPLPLHRSGPPLTLEARAFYRVRTAEVLGPAAPVSVSPDIVLMEAEDGGVVVFPPSSKLVILAAERNRRAARAKALAKAFTPVDPAA